MEKQLFEYLKKMQKEKVKYIEDKKIKIMKAELQPPK